MRATRKPWRPASALVSAEPPARTDPPGPLAIGLHDDSPINILIVDDEPKNLTVLETVLADPGYRLVRAESANQALLALVAEEFALLILDVRMPGTTGFELAQMIKQRKKTAQVPIIFLTAYYNEDQHVLEGYGTGAVDYLLKPLNPTILRSKVSVFARLFRKTRECASINRVLLAEVIERRRVEDELRALNQTLDQQVAQRTEALQQADVRRNEFIALLGHELRNPLAAIQGGVEILRVIGSPQPDAAAGRDMIERQVYHLVRLVDQLLDVSRVSSGKIQVRRAPLDLVAVVREAAELIATRIDARRHQLLVTLPPEPVHVEGDRTRLLQVLDNLLANAVTYTAEGGQIWLTVEGADGGDGRPPEAVVRVRDTGRGLEPSARAALFEPFYQVERALGDAAGGLGLGLALVKRLVELHGGWVEARSAGRGLGSELIVGLPRCPAPAIVAPEPVPAPVHRRLRILVVDDNRDSVDTLADLLDRQGHEVLVAYAGAVAVEVALRERPEVILLDIGLPGMNGHEACRAMRAGGLTDSLIVAMTGYGLDEDRRRSTEAGFDAHHVKPVRLQTIRDLLARVMAG